MKATTLMLAVVGLCGSGRCQHRDEQRAGLARQITDVSAAAESIAHERPELSGAQVMAEMRVDPDVGPLLGALESYQLHVLARNGHAVVLLCCEERSLALLEDSACTPAVDRDETAAPGRTCAFSLDPVAACARSSSR
jgi:hypothetical protein